MSSRMAAGTAAALVGAVIVRGLGGCSEQASSDSGQAPAGAQGAEGAGGERACTLLTATEVSTALGKQVKDGAKPAGMEAQDLCQWESSDLASLSVLVDTASTLEAHMSAWSDAETVDGVGDDAFYSPSNSVFALSKGDVVLQFVVSGMETGPRKLEFFKDVGTKAAARV